MVYPAALQKSAAGVASTNDFDQRSSFSNYGNQVVWLAAPGEQIITTYPGLPLEEAERRLLQASGTQFDTIVVQSFLPLAGTEMPGVFAAAGTTISAAL